MKNADYKHRPLVAMSTTGKLSPIPPTPPSEVTELPVSKTQSIPRPRISPHQPPENSMADGSMGGTIKKFLKSLVGKKPASG